MRQRTQREIATATQIAETRLSDFINGRATPTDDERRRLSETLRVAQYRLFGEGELDQRSA